MDMARHTRGRSARGLTWRNAEDVNRQGEQDGTQARRPSAVPDRERVGASGRGLATLTLVGVLALLFPTSANTS